MHTYLVLVKKDVKCMKRADTDTHAILLRFLLRPNSRSPSAHSFIHSSPFSFLGIVIISLPPYPPTSYLLLFQ
jgi:hypothetical protein